MVFTATLDNASRIT